MRRIAAVAGALAAAALLAACDKGTRPNIATETGALLNFGSLAGDLSQKSGASFADIKAALDEAGTRLDVMLNCFIGPGRKDAPTDPKMAYKHFSEILADQEKYAELRHLRGHIIVTLLARYGAFNQTGQVGDIIKIDFSRSGRNAGDAADTLSAIGDAEYEIRRVSSLFDRSGDPNSGKLLRPYRPKSDMSALPNVDAAYDRLYRVQRISAVAEVLREAGTSTVRGGATIARGVLALAQSPTIGGVTDLYKQIKAAVEKLAILDSFGKAYLEDARTYLEARYAGLNESTPVAINIGHWRDWDELLEDACSRLKLESGTRRDCTPGDPLP